MRSKSESPHPAKMAKGLKRLSLPLHLTGSLHCKNEISVAYICLDSAQKYNEIQFQITFHSNLSKAPCKKVSNPKTSEVGAMQHFHPLNDQSVNGCKTVRGNVFFPFVTTEALLLFLAITALCLTGCKEPLDFAGTSSGLNGKTPDSEPQAKVISSDCVLTSGGVQTGANDRLENHAIIGEGLSVTYSEGVQGSKQSEVRSGFYPPSLIPMAFSVLCPSTSPFPFAGDPRQSSVRSSGNDGNAFSSTLRMAKDIP